MKRKAIKPWPALAPVLIVEDEPKLQQLLRSFLQMHGVTAAVVSSGEEAVRYLGKMPVAAVLLDIKMPGMDGLLTLKRIKTLRPCAVVILVTALEDEQAMADAVSLGASGFLLKPFSLNSLETALLGKLLAG